MVDRRNDRSTRRDRAQLLLTGALAVAFVIIGLVVVVNTLVVTESGVTSETVDESDNVRQFVFESRRNVRRLVLELNHGERNLTGPQLNESIHGNVSHYGQILGEAYGSSGPAYVDLDSHNDTSVWGERIVQLGDQRLRSPGGSPDWWLVENVSSQRRAVGRFVFNAKMSERWLTDVNVTAVNGTGTSIRLELGKERDGELRVDWVASDRPDGSTVCDPTNNRVLVDLVSGRSQTADCRFLGFENVDGPLAIRIENGQGAVGKYGLVANATVPTYDDGTVSTYTPCDPGVTADSICTAPVVWQTNVTVTYDTNGARTDQSHNVSVYP